MALSNRTIYSDIFTNFDENPVSGDVALKTNENAIKQSIRNLILTDRGERPFQRNLGGNIRAVLFENINSQTLLVVREMIRQTLIDYEPRCSIIDITVVPGIDPNEIVITIVFAVINKQEPVTLQLVLDRVR